MKVSPEIRKAILESKGKLSVKQICEQHGLSKATVHRIISTAKDSPGADSANIVEPTTTFEQATMEMSDLLNNTHKNDNLRDQEEKQESKFEKNTLDRLADSLFADEVEPQPKKSKRQPPALSILPMPPTNDFSSLEQRNLIEQKIILNVDNFGSMFSFIKDKETFVKSLHSKSLRDLEGILQTIETTRSTVNLSNQMKHTFFMASRGVEVLGSAFLSLKLHGLTNAFQQQQKELDMIFREIAIENAQHFKITEKPHIRLAMLFTMTALQVDGSNRIHESITRHTQAQAQATDHTSGTNEEKYKDL